MFDHELSFCSSGGFRDLPREITLGLKRGKSTEKMSGTNCYKTLENLIKADLQGDDIKFFKYLIVLKFGKFFAQNLHSLMLRATQPCHVLNNIFLVSSFCCICFRKITKINT